MRAGEKRKSGVGEDEAAAIKKRRKNDGLEARDNVVFIPFEKRLAPLPPKVHDQGRFALLPDWKERFPEVLDDGSPTSKRMPADMRRAAEAEDDEDDEEDRSERPTADDEEMEVDPDEYADEDDNGAGPDQDVIMQVLRQKLADSGLGDVDESVFKDAIEKMLLGEGGSEDALGGLTSLLLGQKDGGGKAFQGFLAGQGVDIHREEDAEEEADEDEEENDQEEGESHTTTATPKKRTRSKPTSTSTATPNHKTPTNRGKSKATTSNTNTTTTTNSKSKPASPIVVPSPPPLSFKTSRKRRAPSLDEPAAPQPEAPSSSAKPAAKRRRAPRAEPPTTEPESAPSVAPATGRRTTRSAAAAGKGGR